jgi:hypothetical protein
MSALQCCDRPFSKEVLQDVSREQEMDVILQEVATPPSDHSDPFFELGRAVSPEIIERQGIWTLRNDSGWIDQEEEEAIGTLGSFEDEHNEEAKHNAYPALVDPEFRAMRNAQLDEQVRFGSFEKHEMREQQARCLTEYARACEREAEELEETVSSTNVLSMYMLTLIQHAEALLALEEKHLTAEIDLLASHEQEKRICALASRHMEAYCHAEVGSERSRNVTDIDRRELEKQHWEAANLERHHKSAINVLREIQARHLRRTVTKYSQDMHVLTERHESKLNELEHGSNAQNRELLEITQANA